jgi:hypothetical protein
MGSNTSNRTLWIFLDTIKGADHVIRMARRDIGELLLASTFDATTGACDIVGDTHEFQVSEQRRKDPSTTRVLLRKMLANGAVIADTDHHYAMSAGGGATA